MAKKDWTIISVGGSIVIPKDGFDIGFLKKFRAFILKQVKKGERFVLVVGGGGTCRQYQQAAKKVANLSDTDLDWIGIYSLTLNAQFLRLLLKDVTYPEVIDRPTKRIKTNKSVIIGSAWKPKSSSDYDAVQWAKTYKAKNVINLSNIDFVFDKDPNKFRRAKKIEDIDWKTFRRDVVGYTWSPGKNAPFDPIASRDAQKLGLTVSILNGKNLTEVGKAIAGKKFKGTVIHP